MNLHQTALSDMALIPSIFFALKMLFAFMSTAYIKLSPPCKKSVCSDKVMDFLH